MTPPLTVRCFARPQPSTEPLGKLTLDFVELVTVGLRLPMRVLTPPPGVIHQGVLPKEWEKHTALFSLGIDGPYANVVASDQPEDWARLWTINVPNIILTTRALPLVAPGHPVRMSGYCGVVFHQSHWTPTHQVSWEAVRVPVAEIGPTVQTAAADVLRLLTA